MAQAANCLTTIFTAMPGATQSHISALPSNWLGSDDTWTGQGATHRRSVT
jgi:hypothetical protein